MDRDQGTNFEDLTHSAQAKPAWHKAMDRRMFLATVPVVALFLVFFGATHTAVAAAPDTFKDCDACPEMVVIPAGSFTMGSPASKKAGTTKRGHSIGSRFRAPSRLASTR